MATTIFGRHALFVALVVSPCLSGMANAEEIPSIPLSIQDHRFTPAEIHVPARQAVILAVDNKDPSAEEFESSPLKIEKVIAGGKKATVRLRPLEPGRYPFIGEYHQDTAQGVIVAE